MLDSKEFSALIDVLGEPVLVVNQSTWRIFHCNNSCEDFLGQEIKGLKGRSIYEYLDEKGAVIFKAAFEILRSSVKGQAIRETFVTIKRKSGRLVNANLSMSSFSIGQERFIILSIEDLSEVERLHSEKQRLEQEIAQVSKLVDVETLMTGMAHELSAPLAEIQNFAFNIQSTLKKSESYPEELEKQARQIIQNTILIEKTIEKILRKSGEEDLSSDKKAAS